MEDSLVCTRYTFLSTVYPLFYPHNLFFEFEVILAHLLDFLESVKNGSVILPPENSTYLLERHAKYLSHQIHGGLTCQSHRCCASAAIQILKGNVEGSCNLLCDF